MRAVLTRVKNASVTINGSIRGRIEKGFLILLGVHEDDTDAEAKKIADKICGLRIFEDEAGKMNKSLSDIGGSILSISQFTLYADSRHGNRPSFTDALPGDKAIILPCIHLFHTECIKNWLKTQNTCPICKFKLTGENLNPSVDDMH